MCSPLSFQADQAISHQVSIGDAARKKEESNYYISTHPTEFELNGQVVKMMLSMQIKLNLDLELF